MNYRATLRGLGIIYISVGGAMLVPAAIAFFSGDGGLIAFLISAGIAVAIGTGFLLSFREKIELRIRDGFALVTLGWVGSSILGALPYALTGVCPDLVHALFESTSGFTTTGATIFSDVESLPRAIIFWRSLTQWLGGMGIIVISVAVLPTLGIGGMQLFKAEIPGPASERLSPRIQSTARILWSIYVGLTALEVVLLLLGGVGLFDAACFSLSTASTGGFSPRNESIGAFHSAYVESVVILTMWIAGANFSLHFWLIRRQWRRYTSNEEFRVYAGMILIAAILLWSRLVIGLDQPILPAARSALFHATAILTGTGFYTTNYLAWGFGAQLLLFSMLFVGGCAGSTAGGMKVLRVVVLAKHGLRQMRKLLHPKGIFNIRLSGRPIPDDVMTNILGFFLLYMFVYVAASLLLTATGVNVVTAFGASIACLSNVGPGLDQVGPTLTYVEVPNLGKLLLSLCMILGRLELITVLVMLTPMFWRKT